MHKNIPHLSEAPRLCFKSLTTVIYYNF